MEGSRMTEKQIYNRAIEKWGEDAQILMVFEEMSELQKELCKNWRGKDNAEQIAEEVADVEIVLAQLKMIYGIADMVSHFREEKLMRLEARLKSDV